LTAKICKTPGCNGEVKAKGLCGKCYAKLLRKTDPHGHYLANKRWRHRHPNARQRQKDRNYARGDRCSYNRGLPYQDMEKVMVFFKILIDDKNRIIDKSVRDRVIAEFIGRSVRNIQSLRNRIKKDPSLQAKLTRIKKNIEHGTA